MEFFARQQHFQQVVGGAICIWIGVCGWVWEKLASSRWGRQGCMHAVRGGEGGRRLLWGRANRIAGSRSRPDAMWCVQQCPCPARWWQAAAQHGRGGRPCSSCCCPRVVASEPCRPGRRRQGTALAATNPCSNAPTPATECEWWGGGAVRQGTLATRRVSQALPEGWLRPAVILHPRACSTRRWCGVFSTHFDSAPLLSPFCAQPPPPQPLPSPTPYRRAPRGLATCLLLLDLAASCRVPFAASHG